MAAVLAGGPFAVLSHRSAAVLWKMLPEARSRRRSVPTMDVIVTKGDRERPRIRIRRIRTLKPKEMTLLKGIPITTPSRTIYDLASTTTPRRLEQAFAEALERKMTTPDKVRLLMKDHPRGPGTRRLRAMLSHGKPKRTHSEAEERFLSLLRKAQLTMPAVNEVILGYEVDFLWRNARLVVEIDGYEYHSSRRAFEGDRRRDAVLAAAGLRVVRITWRQLVNEPEALLVRLVQALGSEHG
jgi:very-short-patch-repair endonuclease